MNRTDARRSDRYLISLSKFAAVLETEDGQSVRGHLCDVSAGGCMFAAPAGQLKLRMNHGAVVTAGGHRIEGRIVRSSIFGVRANLGIEVAEMPAALLDCVSKIGGALRYDGRIVSIVGILAMPVAVQAMRLIRQPATVAVDLRHCVGMELAGAGFLSLAHERGKRIINVNAAVAKLIALAGIELSASSAAESRGA